MMLSLEQLERLLQSDEDERLEFKEAKRTIDSGKLKDYCAALANEGGGRLILGVTNERPRRIVGSDACAELSRTKEGLMHSLHLKIDATEIHHPDGRVVVFAVPARPIGIPISVDGRYWMRSGEALVQMTADQLKRIFEETVPDFSATICQGAELGDLSADAIERFRESWFRQSSNPALLKMRPERLLIDAELLVPNSGVTYAALVLLGETRAMGRFLAQAEVIYEYRSNKTAGPAQHRREYREGCLLFLDELWEAINARNDVQHFQDGLFMRSIPTFSEAVVREALLNAVAHRDYHRAESVFIRQFPDSMEIVSPGGLPPGITTENILRSQSPRNRRIAEAFAKCGLVERAGQGIDRMFEESIRQGKALPDFTGTDDHRVSLTLLGHVRDPVFPRFLERLGSEKALTFGTDELLVLDLVGHERDVPASLDQVLHQLVDLGVIESHGHGRGTRYMLPRKYYELSGRKGVYTRRRGLDRETCEQLILKHIRENAQAGTPLQELTQVLPHLSYEQVKKRLYHLKATGEVRLEGSGRAARWYPQGPA